MRFWCLVTTWTLAVKVFVVNMTLCKIIVVTLRIIGIVIIG